jgi:hypothetical protein
VRFAPERLIVIVDSEHASRLGIDQMHHLADRAVDRFVGQTGFKNAVAPSLNVETSTWTTEVNVTFLLFSSIRTRSARQQLVTGRSPPPRPIYGL